MKFVKGQWYTDGESYYQYVSKGINGHIFRKPGTSFTGWIDPHDFDKLTPASLTPDFSNAKVGDVCFSVHLGICHIADINTEHDDFVILRVDNGKGCSDAELIEYEGYKNHPEVFNSFAQFISYWAEEGLKMKGGY